MYKSLVLYKGLFCYQGRLPLLQELLWDCAHKFRNILPSACCLQGWTCLSHPAEDGVFAEKFQQCIILLRKRIKTRVGLGEPGTPTAAALSFFSLGSLKRFTRARRESNQLAGCCRKDKPVAMLGGKGLTP